MKYFITTLFLSIGILAMAQVQEPDSLKPVTKGTISVIDGQVTTDTQTVQVDSLVGDTTRIELRNAYITIVNKVKNNDDDDDEDSGRSDKYQLTWWTGLDLGVNGILGADHDFQLGDASYLEPEYGKSRYIAFNFAQAKIKIYKNYIGLTTGLSFEVYNYKYGGSNEFVITGDSLFSVPSGDKNITKNKLRASYFAIPLLLEFNTSQNPRKSFHVSAGVIGKVKIENMYKQKYSFEGNENKASIKGDLGFNTWGLDATARIGYRRLTVFAQIGLLPLFDNDNTPDVYTFATGFFIKV